MNANRSPQSLHADCVPISVVLPRNVCSFVHPRCSIWQQRKSIRIDTTLHSGHDTRLLRTSGDALHVGTYYLTGPPALQKVIELFRVVDGHCQRHKRILSKINYGNRHASVFSCSQGVYKTKINY